jgi:hypothetical protein
MGDRKQPDQLALAMKQASMVRMLALAKALQEQGKLRTSPVRAGVKRPGVCELRVKLVEKNPRHRPG